MTDPRPGERLRVLVATVAHSPQDARIRHRQIQALLDHGHEVTFVAPFGAFKVQPWDGIRCLDVPRSRGLQRLGPVYAAWRLMRREAPRHDVVIGHDPELLPALLALRQKRPGRPALQVVWDVHEDVPAQMVMMTWLPRLLRAPAVAAARFAERVAERRLRLTLAEHAYAGRFRHPHPVVPNSVLVPPQIPAPAAADGPRVIYVGAITAARGVEEMLQVAAALPDGVTLELIGNAVPELDQRLRREAARPGSNLDYRGFVPNRTALGRLLGAVAGLSLLHDHANYAHSQPTKIMEYMAHGVPTITTPNRSSRELVERHRAGFVVDFGDVDAVSAHVRTLLADPDLRDRMGTAGHDAALARFNWAVDGAEFVAQLQQWCAGQPAAGPARRPSAPAGSR